VHNLKDYYRAEDFAAAEKFLEAAEAKELSPSRCELVRRLRVRHDHAKLFFAAVANKTKANTEALVAYRKKHGYPLYTWSEQYFGDITGIEGLLGPDPSKAKKKKNSSAR
jgi:cell division septation protein DedD